MNDHRTNHTEKESREKSPSQKWPWWEPYVFTALVLAAFGVLLIVFGHIAQIPFVEHFLFALMTLVAVIEAFRRSTTAPSVAANGFLVVFFGLACFAYLARPHLLFGIGYAILATVWLCLTINAFVVRRRQRKETSEKLNRAVETLRRAVKTEK